MGGRKKRTGKCLGVSGWCYFGAAKLGEVSEREGER